MNTQEIATRLHELCAAEQWDQAQKELYSDDIISHEPGRPDTVGLATVQEKLLKWQQEANIESSWVKKPLVCGDMICMEMGMKCAMQGQTHDVIETAMYLVQDGKIAEEWFFYSM